MSFFLKDSFPFETKINNDQLESALDWINANLPDLRETDPFKFPYEYWRTNYSIIGSIVTIAFRTQEDLAYFILSQS